MKEVCAHLKAEAILFTLVRGNYVNNIVFLVLHSLHSLVLTLRGETFFLQHNVCHLMFWGTAWHCVSLMLCCGLYT